MKQDFSQEWVHDEHALSLPPLTRCTAVLILLIFVIGSLAACVSTPTTPPVISKQQDIAEKVQNNTQGATPLKGAPQTVKDTITHGAVTLNMNAQLQLPQTSQIPVVSVLPGQFKQDTADKVIKTFMEGKQLYQPGGPETKEEVQKEYILHQALQLQSAQSNNGTANAGNAPGAREMDASEWQKAIDEAPETVKKAPTTGLLVRSDEGNLVSNGVTYKGFHGQFLDVVADLGMGYDASLKVWSSDSGKDSSVQFVNRDITSVYTYSALTGNARGMKMSLEETKALAQNTLNAVGATGLTLADVQLGTLIPLTKNDNPDTMNQAYGLWFTRNVAGVSTTMDQIDARPPDNEAYPYERVFMLINDTGVIEFSWTSPVNVVGTVSSNAKILSFNDTMNIFKEQFFIHYAQNDASQGSVTYTINRITLGMMRVQVKDSDSGYLMIPVWDFYGSASTNVNGTISTTDHTLQSFLTINALDGSIIDRHLGY